MAENETCPSACVERNHPGREHNPEQDGCYCSTPCEMGPTCPGALAQGMPDAGCYRMAENEHTAENGLRVPDRLDSMQSTKTLFSERTGHDDPDWMRPWPFGPVHYSQDWSARTDGRFDAVCGKSPIFWPETQWPEHKVCADCKAWVEEHGTPVPMLYQTRVIPPAKGEAL